MLTLRIELHANYFITVCQTHTDDTHGYTTGTSYIGLMETDTLTIFCHKENIL